MTCADKIAEALAALEELANMPLGISLADWSRLSSPILESLREQAPADLADAQAQENGRLRGCFEQIEEAALNGCLTPDLVARITRAALGDAQAQEIERLQADGDADDTSALARDVLAELERARRKFPGKNVTFAALVEEVGELATAIFEESAERVRKEAVQVAVMAMRVILDGDHAYEPWRSEKGLDPLCPQARAALGDAP